MSATIDAVLVSRTIAPEKKPKALKKAKALKKGKAPAKARKALAAGMEDWTDVYRVPAQGNRNGGQRFELTRAGQKVKQLTIWTAGDRLRGVRVVFSDDVQKQAGVLDGSAMTLTLHPDEMIVSTIIAHSNYKAGRAGYIQLATDFGQRYSGGFDWSPIMFGPKMTPYSDLTKGTLIGVYGGAGADLDHLGILLARPTDVEYIFQDVHYDISSHRTVSEKLVGLKEVIVRNDSAKATTTPSATLTYTYASTKNWSNTAGLKVGVKASFKTGIPFISEGKLEVSVEGSYSYTWGETSSKSVTDSWVVPVQVPPKSRVRVQGTVTESVIDVPYTANILARRSDGTIRTLQNISGVYRGVVVGRLTVDVVDI